MKLSLETALDNTELLYSDIVKIANDMLEDIIGDVNSLVKEASDHVESLTNEELRVLMLKLSSKAFSLGETKEKAALKARCSEILKDEAYATNFNSVDGKVEERKNAVTLKISKEIVVEALYDLVANLLKTKLDSCHRVVDTLKTVLMSRASDVKLSSLTGEGE